MPGQVYMGGVAMIERCMASRGWFGSHQFTQGEQGMVHVYLSIREGHVNVPDGAKGAHIRLTKPSRHIRVGDMGCYKTPPKASSSPWQENTAPFERQDQRILDTLELLSNPPATVTLTKGSVTGVCL